MKVKALSKKSSQREFNNISTNRLPETLGILLGGLVGSAGGLSGIQEGAKIGLGVGESIASKTGWHKFDTKPFIPMTASQARNDPRNKKQLRRRWRK